MIITLSKEDQELLQLLGPDGLTIKEIAAKTNKSRRTITKRLEFIRNKYNCLNLRQLIFLMTNSGVLGNNAQQMNNRSVTA